MSGRGAQIMVDVHRKYGDVVRVAPNELSFASLQSYLDMYGHVMKGRGRFLKSSFYEDSGPPRVTNATDPEVHARQRKALSHAFSAKALRDQEVVVQEFVDLLMKQLSKLGEDGQKAIDVSDAFNWVTFDIIGDLAFGDSFNAVAEGKTHSWIATIFEGIKYTMVQRVEKRWAPAKLIRLFFMPKLSPQKARAFVEFSLLKAQKRMELGGTSKRGLEDFFGHMIRKNSITVTEMQSQARTLILAGSETTATLLTGLTYYLLRNPECLAKLQQEIRGAFNSLDEITGDAVSHLKYMHGVIEEGLRVFPPVSFGLPRVSPGEFVDGHYVPAGVGLSNNCFVMARDPRYWSEPDTFRPERWIGENTRDQLKASQPFSMGARGCLGINLAYLEMRIILAKIVYLYDMELETKDIQDWTEACKMMVIWEKPNLLVKFHPVTAH